MAHSDADIAIFTKHGTSVDEVILARAKSLRSNDLGDILLVVENEGKFNSQEDKDAAAAAVEATSVMPPPADE
jgi:hypothetical protein